MPIRKTLLREFKVKGKKVDFWVNNLLFLTLFLTFWPITFWFTTNAADQSRLFHGLVVLGMATIALVKFGNVPIENVLTLNASARRALVASFSFLLIQLLARKFAPASWLGPVSLLTIPAYCCALAASVRYVLGEGTTRISRTSCGALCAFLLISAFMGPLDWPLRGLAGQFSAHTLAFIGKPVQLGLIGLQSGPPKLILLVDTHPFHVAAECNGFGVILTSLMLALLLAIYRQRGLLGIIINLSVGLALSFLINILRIVVIVLLAPSMMDHYMLMHEVVGTITYWGSLLLIWILLKGPTKPETE